MSKNKNESKKKPKAKSRGLRYYVTNTCSIAIVLFLGGNYILDSVRAGSTNYEITAAITLMSFSLVLLMLIMKGVGNFSSLSFYAPFILFLFYTFLMVFDGWVHSSNYLLACLCISLISCQYSNFKVSLIYILSQYFLVATFILGGLSVAGPGVLLIDAWFTWAISLFGALVLLMFTSTGAIILGKAVADQNSFRTMLSTTTSNIVMVDNLNRVVYVSKSLSELTGIEDPQLTIGRPLIDLFPGRGLKLLVHTMLKNKAMWTADWEFSLDGHKRYFAVTSTSLPGLANSALINLRDMTHLAERDEIAVMKDSLKIGLFFMDKDFIIQDHYSRFLTEMLSETDLFGKRFPELLAASVTAKELAIIQDYFDMVFSRSFDQSMLNDLNPLNELHYVSITDGVKKVFHCDFTTIERDRGQVFALVTIYDITAKIELQQKLLEKENRRQEEMQSIFELIQVEQDVFNDFQEDADEKFTEINEILKNKELPVHEVLVEVYQSVHAIKSNAVILGLNTFGNKAHKLESTIKKLREQEGEVPFDDMLNLTIEIEHLAEDKEGFKAITQKIQSFGKNTEHGKNQSEYVLVESLSRATNKAATDMGKKVQFIVDEIDPEAMEKGPTRVMKDVLMQLVRNSVVHGVEGPEERIAKGKEETGSIRLSIKLDGKKILVKLEDDGKGLDYKRIREKAEQLNIIKKEDENNRDILIKAIFSPEFSTAEETGLHAGRGMGLNLVQDRVRNARGSIALQSKTDKGLLFSISIPI